MIQHYNEEHKAYIQYIQNDSDSLHCIATTAVKYRNMLQMGDPPVSAPSKDSKTKWQHQADDGRSPEREGSESGFDKSAQGAQKEAMSEKESRASKSVESIGTLSAAEEATGSLAGQIASSPESRNAVKDISRFTREVYEQVTGSV